MAAKPISTNKDSFLEMAFGGIETLNDIQRAVTRDINSRFDNTLCLVSGPAVNTAPTPTPGHE